MVRQKAIVGKLKKFPPGVQRFFSLGCSFSSSHENCSLFFPFKGQGNGQNPEKHENGLATIYWPLSQTYPEWKVMCDFHKIHSLQKRKQFKKRKMCVLPMGTADEERVIKMAVQEFQQNAASSRPGCSSLLEVAVTFLSLFFCGMDVELLNFQDIEVLGFTSRVHSLTKEKQILVSDILEYLKKIKPNDCFCLIAWSSLDLYPNPEMNFVLGEACFGSGCAVVSFGHYSDMKTYATNVEDSSRVEEDISPVGTECVSSSGPMISPQYRCNTSAATESIRSAFDPTLSLGSHVVWRVLKVLTHEACHLIGMHHCTFFTCLMNESKNVNEAQEQPLFLCPVCLRKLQKFLQFSVEKRYEAMKRYMEHYCCIVRTTSQNSSSFDDLPQETPERCDRSQYSNLKANDQCDVKYLSNVYTLDKLAHCVTWLKSVIRYINSFSE